MGGKGGVGKTTCAAALGLLHAAAATRTLVVSTDPAPSLGDALDQRLTGTPRAIPGTRGLLQAAEIDSRRAMSRWLRGRRSMLQTIALRGTWLDESDVEAILRQTLPGLDELAALFEILGFARSGRYDLVVLDTAPTGHTLRLLELPDALSGVACALDRMQAKHRAVVGALRGHWSGDEADALIAELHEDATDLRACLCDRDCTRVSWVTLPETLAVAETGDGVRALKRLGIPVHEIVVNRLTPPEPGPCRWCRRRRAEEGRILEVLERTVMRAFPIRERPALTCVPAQEREPVGPRALRRVAAVFESGSRGTCGSQLRTAGRRPAFAPLPGAACDRLRSRARLMLFGGKGGVGKTTCAAAVALDIAERTPTEKVLLLSTDPAHSLADVLTIELSDVPRRIPGGPPNLDARELDASAALARWRHEIGSAVDRLFDRLERRGANAAYDRGVVRDLVELAPPGLDEIAAISDVLDLASATRRGDYDRVVVDTAPTGHALRLLEMPGLLQRWVHTFMRIVLKYQPIVGAGDLGPVLLGLSKGLGGLRRMLADEGHTQFVVVARAARLPRAETQRLVRRLARLRVPIGPTIVNAAGAGECSRCRHAALREQSEIRALRRATGSPALILAPSSLPPPRGLAALRLWRRAWRCGDGGSAGN